MIFPFFSPNAGLFCGLCLFCLYGIMCLIMELTFFLFIVMSFTIFYVVCAKTPSYFILFDCYTVLHWTDIPV